jgi:hypothetical protein
LSGHFAGVVVVDWRIGYSCVWECCRNVCVVLNKVLVFYENWVALTGQVPVRTLLSVGERNVAVSVGCVEYLLRFDTQCDEHKN